MHVIFFTKYTRAGASSRYRSLQYLPALRSAGLHITVSPLLDETYLARKYAAGRGRPANLLGALIRRLWSVLTVPRDAVLVIEYELLPWCPAVLERWLAWRGCPMVVDYDDALFHQYDAHSNQLVRRLLGRKIATVMRLAQTVVAGNEYLAGYARRAGARRLEVIPTVIDLARYPLQAQRNRSDLFTIGWIGSPSTARYLLEIAPALAEICRGGRARVRLVGSGPINLPGVPVEIVPWNESTEVDEIQRFDVGIMPLPDEPWARGKCGFKLIQYMGCSLPVVASPVGVNSEIVEDGVNGFLAWDGREWVAALKTLTSDTGLRERLGAAGRRKVEERYCLDVTARKLADVLRAARYEASEARRIG